MINAPKYRDIKRVALYLRVSTKEQAQGYSLDSQREALSEWAEDRGWQIADIYEDAGASGTTVEGRLKFQEMIARAQMDEFDAVLVLMNDRFARSRRDAVVYKDLLNGRGIRVLSRTEPAVGDASPAGFLMEGMSDVWAAYYSVQLSENVSRGKAARVRRGLPLGDISFGYRSVDAKTPPEVVPEEAGIIRRAFEGYAGGNLSMLELADMINGAGFKPRSKRGRTAFSKATVAGMLSNPFYVGDITYHGEVIGQGLHKPIVSRQLWEKVQEVRKDRARRPQVFGARTKRAYLLAGVAVCSRCGHQLWANTTAGGRHTYYRCSARNRGATCEAKANGCPSDRADVQLAALFVELDLPDAWRDRVAALMAEDGDNDSVPRERKRLEDKIMRVQQGLIDGLLDNVVAKAAIKEAQAALAALPRGEAAVHYEAGERLVGICDIWNEMTPDEKHELVRMVLARIEVNVEAGTVEAVIPKPAFAPLFRVLSEEESGLISICGWRPRSDSNRRSPA